MATTLAPVTTAAPTICYNSTTPLQVIPCTTAPEPKDFLAQHMWTIILAVMCLLLALTCGCMSYWKYSQKMLVLEERKERRKKKLEEKFRIELEERKRAKLLAAANAANLNEL